MNFNVIPGSGRGRGGVVFLHLTQPREILASLRCQFPGYNIIHQSLWHNVKHNVNGEAEQQHTAHAGT